MEKRKKWFRRLVILSAIVLVYPVFVIGYTWAHVLGSDFKGGRHGPLDAYRHALASAVVSHTLGEWAVDLVSAVFESSGKESNQMDRKNNSIGAAIGKRTESFGELEPRVREQVSAGAERSERSGQITWLPSSRWGDAKFW
jgi:preprotein translocase subunit SecF